MITYTLDTYWIPFIPSLNYVVEGYNYKSINLTKLRTYVKGYTNYYLIIKGESTCINKSDVACRSTLHCLDQYMCRGLRLWNIRDCEAVYVYYEYEQMMETKKVGTLKWSR